MTQTKSSPRMPRKSPGVNAFSVAWALLVHEHQSLRGAAKEIGVGHAALIRRIRDLEDRLGISLFERTPRGVSVTDAGARYLEHAREALEQLDEASRNAAEAGQGAIGELSIGIVSSMAGGFLRELLEDYAARHPGVSIKLSE